MRTKHVLRIVFPILVLLVGASVVMAQTKSQEKTKSAPAASTQGKASTPATPAKKAPVDINSATKSELTAVGLSDAEAQKVIDNRPYKAKNELQSKKILTPDEYKKVSGQLVAKQTPKSSTDKGAAPGKSTTPPPGKSKAPGKGVE
jgi:hypothetical protein